MKSYGLVALLFINSISYLSYTQAVRLHKGEELDADDPDINDAPFKSEKDVAIFQQTFVNEGKSVKAIKNQEQND